MMPRPPTNRQLDALLVYLHYERQLTTPSIIQVAKELGIKKRPALRHIDALHKKGMLWKDPEIREHNRFLTPEGREAALAYEREIEA